MYLFGPCCLDFKSVRPVVVVVIIFIIIISVVLLWTVCYVSTESVKLNFSL
jgi:hypothetical protein